MKPSNRSICGPAIAFDRTENLIMKGNNSHRLILLLALALSPANSFSGMQEVFHNRL
jgi:hypothetical protein